MVFEGHISFLVFDTFLPYVVLVIIFDFTARFEDEVTLFRTFCHLQISLQNIQLILLFFLLPDILLYFLSPFSVLSKTCV